MICEFCDGCKSINADNIAANSQAIAEIENTNTAAIASMTDNSRDITTNTDNIATNSQAIADIQNTLAQIDASSQSATSFNLDNNQEKYLSLASLVVIVILVIVNIIQLRN